MKTRLDIVLNNENGSPMVETLVAISVGICIVSALISLGAVLLKFIGNTTASVTSL